jgi:reactive intermediate/imine deaminase
MTISLGSGLRRSDDAGLGFRASLAVEVDMRVRTGVLLILVAGALAAARAERSSDRTPAQGRFPADVPFSTSVQAGDFIYLAGTLATGADGTLVGGDIRVQTKQVLDNLAAIVAGAGSDMSRVASVTVYLKRVTDFAAMNEVYRTYWPVDPPARTTVVANLVMPEALVEISMIAIRRGAERQIIHPTGWAESANPYSYGVKSGNTLFLAGLISRSSKDNLPIPGNMTAQTKTALDNAGAILKAAGMTFSDVVSSRVYITDTAGFEDMNAAYRMYFPAGPPARATVRTGLTAPQYLVEVSLIAVKDPDRAAITTPNADGNSGRPNPNLSSAIRAGNRLYLSGMLGASDTNKGDTLAQTRETMTRLGRTLKAAGFDWNDVVDAVVYLPRAGDYAAMNEAYGPFFTRGFPARAAVEAGLVSPDGLVEIMMIAARQ